MGSLPGLDEGAVGAWLVANVEGAVGPVEFSLIAGGHSNLTYGAPPTLPVTGSWYGVARPVRRPAAPTTWCASTG